ncbi:MAG: hypothetical protein R2911_25480 [Caldilineaceae bacterium]
MSLQAPVGSRIAGWPQCSAGKSNAARLIAGLLPSARRDCALWSCGGHLSPSRVAYLAQRSEIDWRFPMTVRRLVGTGRYVHLGWF